MNISKFCAIFLYKNAAILGLIISMLAIPTCTCSAQQVFGAPNGWYTTPRIPPLYFDSLGMPRPMPVPMPVVVVPYGIPPLYFDSLGTPRVIPVPMPVAVVPYGTMPYAPIPYAPRSSDTNIDRLIESLVNYQRTKQ